MAAATATRATSAKIVRNDGVQPIATVGANALREFASAALASCLLIVAREDVPMTAVTMDIVTTEPATVEAALLVKIAHKGTVQISALATGFARLVCANVSLASWAPIAH